MRTLMGASKAERLTYRASFLRPEARLVPGPAGGACYTYELAGKYYALAFRGSAGKPEWHHSYRTVEQRDEHIRQFHTSILGTAARKAATREKNSAWTNSLTVGTILYTSWGYDQTNVDFYVITRVSGCAVWTRALVQDSEATGYMQEKVWPKMPLEPCGMERRSIAGPDGCGGTRIKINGHHAMVETGRSHHSSSYA